MLVNPKEIFKKARKNKYAIGAFNTSSFEITRAIINTAERLKSPVIIETSEAEMKHLGADIVYAEVAVLAKKSSIPVALHLDHGKGFESIRDAIRAGYTSIHIDGSLLSFEDNVVLTKSVAILAHNNNVLVEGEMGRIRGTSAHHKEKKIKVSKEDLTDPGEAHNFVKKTKIDILAVAIGNIHGIYQFPPKLDFERLAQISSFTKKPISLHGGSGIPKNQIKKAMELGVAKINVNTELRIAFRDGILGEFDLYPEEVVPYKYLPAGAEAVSKVVEQKIRLFGSAGRA